MAPDHTSRRQAATIRARQTGNGAPLASGPASKIGRLLAEIEALIDHDERADQAVSGGWHTFDDITAAANARTWDAYSIDRAVRRRRQSPPEKRTPAASASSNHSAQKSLISCQPSTVRRPYSLTCGPERDWLARCRRTRSAAVACWWQ